MNKSSFKSVRVERSTSLDKDGEFCVTVLAGIERVLQKMLFNSRVMGNDLRCAVCLAGTGKIKAVSGKNDGF